MNDLLERHVPWNWGKPAPDATHQTRCARNRWHQNAHTQTADPQPKPESLVSKTTRCRWATAKYIKCLFVLPGVISIHHCLVCATYSLGHPLPIHTHRSSPTPTHECNCVDYEGGYVCSQDPTSLPPPRGLSGIRLIHCRFKRSFPLSASSAIHTRARVTLLSSAAAQKGIKLPPRLVDYLVVCGVPTPPLGNATGASKPD